MEGCLEMGFEETGDLNHPDAHSGVVGPWPNNRVNDMRLGTLVTYIRAARGRENLFIRGDAMVDRVLFSGNRAAGVRYIDAAGDVIEVSAGLVVLCAGAYGTPLILQRSGVGPSGDLRRVGIDPVLDLPVGLQLMDHPGCAFMIHAPSLADLTGCPRPVDCRGPLGDLGEPEWQAFAGPFDEVAGHIFVNVNLTRQDAKGKVSVQSADPFDKPLITYRFGDSGKDIDRFEHGFSFCRELVATSAFTKSGAKDLNQGLKCPRHSPVWS